MVSEAIIKGTTPPLLLTIDIDILLLKHIYITLKQRGVEITKTGAEITPGEEKNSLQITLTQEETLRFAAGVPVELQLRATTYEGEAVGSYIEEIPVERVLLGGVIT